MITSILVEDVPQDLALMPAQVTVLHGRSGVKDGPEASSATLLWLHDEPTMPGWVNGDTVKIVGDTGPLFTGRIVEARLEHGIRTDGTTYGLFTVTCAGAVAALGYRFVGDEPWPAESGAARADRILDLAEVPYLIDGQADPMVMPRDVDRRAARELLEELAQSTAAAVVDLPTGEVVYQPMKERARPVHDFPWADFDPAFTWSQFDPAMTWQDFDSWYSNDSEFPLAIPAAAVGFEPTWGVTAADILNHVRVGYGPTDPEQAYTEATDPASITRHGRRYQYFGTQLQNVADAQAYASWILTTSSIGRWALDDIDVHLDLLDEPTRAAVLALTCGDHITVGNMPAPAPAIVAEGIVEGWTYVTWGDRGGMFERLRLHTSALLESLAVPQWSDYPPGFMWSDHSPLLSWADIVSIPA